MKEDGFVKMEFFPQKQPQLNEISPGDFERVLKTVPGLTDQRRDVLAVRSVENIKKGFIRAVGLFFKGSKEPDSQLAVVVDGMLSTPHELAFAGTEGFKRVLNRFPADQEELAEISTAKEIVPIQVSQLEEARKVDASDTPVDG